MVLVQSAYGTQIQRRQQLGKIKRKLRSIANTLKQDLEDPLLCIQCGKSRIEDITPTFLSNLGKSFDCCIAPILYSLLLTSLLFTSLHFTSLHFALLYYSYVTRFLCECAYFTYPQYNEDDILTANELVQIKLRVKKKREANLLGIQIAEASSSMLAQTLGHSILLYRQSNPKGRVTNMLHTALMHDVDAQETEIGSGNDNGKGKNSGNDNGYIGVNDDDSNVQYIQTNRTKGKIRSIPVNNSPPSILLNDDNNDK